MSSIMDLIGLELFELSAVESYIILLCLHSSICKFRPISTKLGQNIYNHKISDELDYESNRTGIRKKIAEFDFVYTLASTNINQSVPNLVTMYMTIRTQMISIMVLIGLELS